MVQGELQAIVDRQRTADLARARDQERARAAISLSFFDTQDEEQHEVIPSKLHARERVHCEITCILKKVLWCLICPFVALQASILHTSMTGLPSTASAPPSRSLASCGPLHLLLREVVDDSTPAHPGAVAALLEVVPERVPPHYMGRPYTLHTRYTPSLTRQLTRPPNS